MANDARDGKYISTTEAARLLGISRVAVLKQIKTGRLKARKIGGRYAIHRSSLTPIHGELTDSEREKVVSAVRKAVHDYGDALKRLGSE